MFGWPNYNSTKNVFEPRSFSKTLFIWKKGLVNPIFSTMMPPYHLLMCRCTHQVVGTFCVAGRKPVKINFLTSCSYKNMIFTVLLQSQSYVLWAVLSLFPCLQMLTKETNKKGGSPTRFFLEDECLACECSQVSLPLLLEIFYCKFGHR